MGKSIQRGLLGGYSRKAISSPTLKSILIFLFLVIGLISGGIPAGLSYFRIRALLEERIAFELVHLNRIQTDGFKSWLNEAKRDLALIAEDQEFVLNLLNFYDIPNLKDIHGHTPLKHLNNLLQNKAKEIKAQDEVFLLDLEGKVIASSILEMIRKSRKDSPTFVQGVKGPYTHQPYISGIYTGARKELGERFGRPTLAFSLPVKQQGTPIAVVAIKLNYISVMNEMSFLSKFGYPIDVYFFNKDGLMLSESRFTEDLKKLGLIQKRSALELRIVDPVTGKLTRLVSQCINGVGGHHKRYRNYYGKKVFGACLWIPELEWGLVTEIDFAEFSLPIRRLLLQFLILGLVVMTGIVILSIFLSRSIAAPISELTALADRVGHGDLSNDVSLKREPKIKEQQLLVDSFRQMRSNLLALQEQARAIAKGDLNQELKAEGDLAETLRIMQDSLRKRTEDLQYEKERVQIILNTMASGVFTVDLNLRITSFNPGAEKITGYRAEEIVEKDCSLLKCEFSRDNCELLDPETKFPIFDEERKIVGKNGKEIWILKSAALLRNSRGEIIGGVESFQDITRLKEVDRMKSDFISLVSHELRTPLTSIGGYVDLILDGDVGEVRPKQRDFLEIIFQNTQRLAALIDDLLDIEKIESGKIKAKLEKVDLNEVVKDCINTLKVKAEDKGLKLEKEIKAAQIKVLGDYNLLFQVFSNLLFNAIKYTKEGRVKVTAQTKGRFTSVTVEDTGVGISQEDLRKIFSRFFRAEDSYVRKTSGTGLGLSITKSIIKRHNGDIRVESKLGVGSKFEVILPLLKELKEGGE